jgi:hypothetical protein
VFVSTALVCYPGCNDDPAFILLDSLPLIKRLLICSSRWGHQIPAYLVKVEGENTDESDNDVWVTGRTEEEAQKKAEEKFPGKKFTLEQDPDVLDTW